jgi:predicted RNA-binding Zn-ribbon protein involved in translation (DUF1610 family)
MNLISCESCGVVLNKEVLRFPTNEQMWNEERGEYNPDFATYSQFKRDYVAYVPCPCCGEEIRDE